MQLADYALAHKPQRGYSLSRPYAPPAADACWPRTVPQPASGASPSNLRSLAAALLNPRTFADHPFLLSGLTAIAFSTYYFPYSTQNAYFLHIIARWGDLPSLQSDWLYHTPEPYIFFNYLHFFVGFFAGYEALTTLILFISVFTLGFFALYRLLTACFGVPLWFSAAFILLLCNPTVSFFLGQYKIAPAAVLLGGIASQSLFFPAPLYYQPSTLDVLFFVCLWLIYQSRYASALTISSLIVLLHPIMLTSSFFLYCALMITLWKRATIKQLALWSAVSLSIVLPLVGYHLSLNFGFDKTEIALAKHIMLDVRTPHETAVAVWFSSGDALRLAFIAFGSIVLFARYRESPVIRVFLLFVAMSVFASLVAFATGNPDLRLLEPWRASTIYLPLLTIFSLWVLARRAVQPLWRFSVVRTVVVGGMVASLLSPVVTSSILSQRTREATIFLGQLQNFYDGTKIFAHLPRSFDGVRLRGGVPIFVDFKTPAFTARDLIEWDRRVRFLDTIDFSACAEVRTVLAKEGIGFVILHKLLDTEQLIAMRDCGMLPALESDKFALYRLDGA